MDAHVGRSIFERCILSKLRNKTIVLVTHQLQFVSASDWIVFMRKDGTIEMQDTYDKMMEGSQEFYSLITTHVKAIEKKTTGEDNNNNNNNTLNNHTLPIDDSNTTNINNNGNINDDDTEKEEEIILNDNTKNNNNSNATTTPQTLIAKEEREIGMVKSDIYRIYIAALGGLPILLVLVFVVLTENGSKMGTGIDINPISAFLYLFMHALPHRFSFFCFLSIHRLLAE